MKEYYPNGRIKHKIYYYGNGNISSEYFYDKNGRHHRENNLPDYRGWYENGRLWRKTYTFHGKDHNINGPASLYYHKNGKLGWKFYYLKWLYKDKLEWANSIKNI